jgi:hypothetical protein
MQRRELETLRLTTKQKRRGLAVKNSTSRRPRKNLPIGKREKLNSLPKPRLQTKRELRMKRN